MIGYKKETPLKNIVRSLTDEQKDEIILIMLRNKRLRNKLRKVYQETDGRIKENKHKGTYQDTSLEQRLLNIVIDEESK